MKEYTGPCLVLCVALVCLTVLRLNGIDILAELLN